MIVMPFQFGHRQRPIIVTDDDDDFRETLVRRLEVQGLKVEAFASLADAEQRVHNLADAACLLLDFDLYSLADRELQVFFTACSAAAPIIFMSRFADVRTAVQAMKAGAVDFLCKPIADDSLQEAVAAAYSSSRDPGLVFQEANLAERYSALTSRQKEIMALVVTGLMNKQIAYRVGLSEITVKVHRSHLMHKLGARSVVELVHIAHALGNGLASPINPLRPQAELTRHDYRRSLPFRARQNAMITG